MQVPTDYTFGHDEIAQRVATDDGQGTTTDETHVFGHDGHGSVRVLYDLAATAGSLIEQLITYSAYGSVTAVHGATGNVIGTSEAAAITSLLYSGESFDRTIQRSYNRSRWYDPRSAQWNRLDPFVGNKHDPQSLHKYAYVHSDPVAGTDPSGRTNLISSLGSLGVRAVNRARSLSAASAAYKFAISAVLNASLFATISFTFTLVRGGSFGDAVGNARNAAALGIILAVPFLGPFVGYLLLGKVMHDVFTGKMDELGLLEIAAYVFAARFTRSVVTTPPPGGMSGGKTPSINGLSKFAEAREAEIADAVEAKMLDVGIPAEAIGFDGSPIFPRGFSASSFQGGGNHPLNTGEIFVDAAIFDSLFIDPGVSPTWGRARASERAEAIMVHEYIEGNLDNTFVGVDARHSEAVRLAPETDLNISENARAILREQLKAQEDGSTW